VALRSVDEGNYPAAMNRQTQYRLVAITLFTFIVLVVVLLLQANSGVAR
jgi:hypothetical protein